MDSYELWLLLHIVAAIIWLGAAFVLTLQVLRASLAGDAAQKAELNATADWLAPRLFIPASLATFVFGLITMIDGPWGLDQLWVALGLAGFLASFLTGILYFKPESERIDALVAEHGAQSPEVVARIDRLETIGRIELVVLFLVVADMVIKPTGDDTGILIVMALVLAGAAAALLTGSRSRA
jgi:uncharacterized membrane protein